MQREKERNRAVRHTKKENATAGLTAGQGQTITFYIEITGTFFYFSKFCVCNLVSVV
jgi:hypothetical protein